MGAVSSMVDRFYGDDSLKIVCLGLDATGKATILHRLKWGESARVLPTIGFNVETVVSRAGRPLTLWVVNGKDKTRVLWKHYADNTQGIFYVVDSNDHERMSEASDELASNILLQDDFKGIPLVVLANKQDLPNAASCEEIAETLHLYDIKDRKWHIQATCGISGVGLNEALALMCTWASEFKQQSRS